MSAPKRLVVVLDRPPRVADGAAPLRKERERLEREERRRRIDRALGRRP